MALSNAQVGDSYILMCSECVLHTGPAPSPITAAQRRLERSAMTSKQKVKQGAKHDKQKMLQVRPSTGAERPACTAKVSETQREVFETSIPRCLPLATVNAS